MYYCRVSSTFVEVYPLIVGLKTADKTIDLFGKKLDKEKFKSGTMYHINEKVKGIDINARVSILDENYKYFQISPATGLPFFIRYDRAAKKWRTAAEISKTDPKVVEVVGSWINEKFPVKK